MGDTNNQITNTVPLSSHDLNGKWAVAAADTYSQLRTCLNCGQQRAGYHDCLQATAVTNAVINFWKCGACGQYVSGAFHTCVPLTFAHPTPERKPHTCPVCAGTGEVDDTQHADTTTRAKQCPACKGECVLWSPA